MMEAERISVCPNDCMLFRGVHKDLKKCLKCNASRYKQKSDKIESTKGANAKVIWYLPILPRLQRLFSNPKDAKLLLWHVECRKEDGMLRHPADSPEWTSIDIKHRNFASDPRNLRIGLCTDGMNPYGNMSSHHSTWPVLLCIYNLSPWLCMKRRYIMMLLMISGPKQPGNDIDVFLALLIEELKSLWENGARVWDAYRKEFFTLFVMLLCTINDFPAYGNLSDFKTKGARACPICQEHTCSIWLKKNKKTVYLGHRKFLSRLPKRRPHPYRKMTKEFNGKIENDRALVPLTGVQMFEKLKDKNVEFGKRKQK
jgi:Transposase family tnp2